jgi:type VI secretion system ImpJ/VasE family protein
METRIHWHQGLFLQPHHFQRLQHSIYEVASAARRFSTSYHSGVCELKISEDELGTHRLRFERLRAIMTSGLEVNLPANADLPSYDFKSLFENDSRAFLFYLAVPLWQAKRANAFKMGEAVQDPREKLLYRLQEETLYDENTGETPKSVYVRRINARIISDRDDHSDMEILPVLRIIRDTGAGEGFGKPRADVEYVPPSLFLESSNVLCSMVQDLISQVEANREELSEYLVRGGFDFETMRGVQYEHLLRFRTLSRFCARAKVLLKTPAIPPHAWYLELCEQYADLVALHPGKEKGEGILDYNHDGLYLVFRQLDTKIRSLLRSVVSASFMEARFKAEDVFYSAELTNEHFSRAVEYYLAIRSKEDPRKVVTLVEDPEQFRLIPRSLARSAVRGLSLKEERVAPIQLPVYSDLTYFRIDREGSARIWEEIKNEKSIVARWAEMHDTDFKIALYMTTRDGD